MRIVLTTARDNQERVDLPLFRYSEEDPDIPETWITTLSLGNLEAGTRDEQEISLVLTLDENDTLQVIATETSSGNREMVSVALDSSPQPDPFVVPAELNDRALFAEREEEWRAPRRTGNRGYLWVAILLVLLLALAGVLVYMLPRFGAERADRIPVTEVPPQEEAPPAGPVDEAADEPAPARAPAPAPEPAPEVAVEPAPVPESAAAPAPVPAPATAPEPEPAPAPTADPAEPPPVAENGDPISYRIMLGDTLWDISKRYYGTPWLYPEIADRNRIRDPNLIFAEDRILIPESPR
jgi:outer membrane biosynthesis protein TonB